MMMKNMKMIVAMALVMLFAVGMVSAVPGNPSCDFTATPTVGSEDLTVTFTGTALNMSPSFSYHWDFGDGTGAERLSVSTVSPITHTYLTPGKYTVRLAVYDIGIPTTWWVSNTKTDYIFVTHVPPVAGFTRMPSEPSTGMAPETIHFTSTTTGEEFTLLWDFGDGSTSTETNPVHVYTDAGDYTINLTATNDGGSDSATGTLNVRYPKPTASFVATSPTTGQVPLAVQFLDTSVGEGPITHFWQFGDGSTSTAQNPLHAYGTIGLYTVTLTISNDPLRDTDDDAATRGGYINVTNATGPVVCPEPTQCPSPIPSQATIGEFRNGYWFIYGNGNFVYGQPGDIPLLGDWNGDGIDTVGVYRNGVFYLRNSNTGGVADVTFGYGNTVGDVPVTGDWNGDGVDTIGVNRNGVLYLRNMNNAGYADILFGTTGDVPAIT